MVSEVTQTAADRVHRHVSHTRPRPGAGRLWA